MSRDDYSMIPTRIFRSNHGLLTRIDDVIGQVVMVIMTSEDKKSILLTRTDDVIGQVVMVIVMTS